jgi:DNA-directed RNA polymerase subunit alpha
MRIRWRGLELPSRVVRDEQVSTDTYARFTAEPFERGFGTTVGNSLRRILLSSLEGAAVTHIRLKGADHEFSSIPGVMEDVTDIILNIKSLIVKLDADEPKEMRLHTKKAGNLSAGMIEADPSITIVRSTRTSSRS